MTLQQLEYILAVDELRHFGRAAEKCGVTQPTLSAMIQKLEDEFSGNGRVLIRTSGTEPLVRVMIEGDNQELIEEKAKEIAKLIER